MFAFSQESHFFTWCTFPPISGTFFKKTINIAVNLNQVIQTQNHRHLIKYILLY